MKPFARLLAVVVVFSILTSPAHADRKSRLEEKARQERLERQREQVAYILQQENDGRLTDRKQALKELVASGDAPDEAYWQAGYIKKGDQWVSVQDRWLTPEQEQEIDEYAKARSGYVDSDEGHYKLAQWCAENGFDAQAYAHLKSVLLNNPDHAGLRQLLGYQRIGHRWMNVEDFEAAVREADRLAKELQEWGPVVTEIDTGLNSSLKQRQINARHRLKEITDVAAIPALELILLPGSDTSATACVEQLCEIDHRRSSIALCKAALFLPESESATKQAAIDELKTRPLEDFVPVLLGKMQTPLTMKYRLLSYSWTEYSHGPFRLPVAYLQQRHVDQLSLNVLSETQHEIRNHCLQYILNDSTTHYFPIRRQYVQQFLNQNQTIKLGERKTEDDREAEQRKLYDSLYRVERAVRFQNSEIVGLNDEISELLSLVSDQKNHFEPALWWEWWDRQIEVESDNKLERTVQEVLETAEPDHIGRFPASCFTAGTPVWTDRGPRPIEQLHVGDMALTQDVETGELMYRPIIRTTTREPKPLVTIDLGAEQITSTGGHPFFVPGEGWVRARELKAGQFLHTPTGTIKIDGVTETPEDETYNLVVDGFHTYFVGMSQALVHDVSITSPTDAVVPGLLDR
jgi:hypothetical protein